MELDPDNYSRCRALLLGEGSEALIDFMADRGLGRSPDAPEQFRTAVGEGWIETTTGRSTPMGYCISDSCREYRFWRDRGRSLSITTPVRALDAAMLGGRSVLDVGCGMGANLMTLAREGHRVIGIEPMEIYIQMNRIFCEREGQPASEIHRSSAEHTPLGDQSVDVLYCVSALPYMRIDAALAEFYRVLRPGGDAVIILSTLTQVFRDRLRQRPGLRQGIDLAVTTANTLSEMALRRRIIGSRSTMTTTRPVHPPFHSMLRRLRRAGFQIRPETCRNDLSTTYVAHKPER